MNYEEAKKLVQAPKKAKGNFLVIFITYDVSLVLPYDEGLAFLATIKNGEQMVDSYASKKHIKPLDRDRFRTSILSHQEYERYKIAQLLGITLTDLEQFETPQEPS